MICVIIIILFIYFYFIFFSEAVPYSPRVTSDAPGGCCYMTPICVYCHNNNNNNCNYNNTNNNNNNNKQKIEKVLIANT